jgi:hypothetical protein
MDFSEYRAKLEQLGADLDESAQRVLTRMNAKGMNVTVKATPVDTGHLRRMWFSSPAKRVGNGYESRYYNNTFYAGYVNNGHRIVRNGKTVGYVNGVRMLEQGQTAAKESADAIFSTEIQRIKRKGGW